MLFLLNFRFHILKIISYKKHISGYKLSLKNSILDFCPYWNSFENSKLWFWDFPIPKSPNGYLSQSVTLWMNTRMRNCQGCFLLWVPSIVILVFLTGWLEANNTNFPWSVFQREGDLVLPLVFQGRRLEDTGKTHGISNGLPMCQERKREPGIEPPGCAYRTVQLLFRCVHTCQESRVCGDCLAPEQVGLLTQPSSCLLSEEAHLACFTSLHNSYWFLPPSSTRTLFWIFPPKVLRTSPLGCQKKSGKGMFLTHYSMWHLRIKHAPQSEWRAW